MKKISVVISCKNEKLDSFLLKSLAILSSFKQLEVIVVDNASTDKVKAAIADLTSCFVSTEETNRAQKLNLGIAKASADCILLHHPRSYLTAEGVIELLKACDDQSVVWGGFTHAFDASSGVLDFTSWYSNNIRFDSSGIVYLDHCLFYKKSLINSLVTVPEVDIFEDTELSLKLLKHSKPTRLKSLSVTSSVRFKKNGIVRQSLMNQLLKIGYHLKLDPKVMNKIYEKGLSLN